MFLCFNFVVPVLYRQNGIGIGSMCARAGGVIAPMLHLMKGIDPRAPMFLCGLCPLLGSALTLMLPETAHMPLPDTIEDVEGHVIRLDTLTLHFWRGKSIKIIKTWWLTSGCFWGFCVSCVFICVSVSEEDGGVNSQTPIKRESCSAQTDWYTPPWARSFGLIQRTVSVCFRGGQSETFLYIH